ncbi:cation diffusion facilitator family transporter [Chitinasiproducens palmae]|uniref:Cation diffusion facilitator family transporter n=1 Tax=Chitinasiproducens palmae TaxID=1770053 RepID=A0A1H2PPA4_9BURK|nr:cation diffusion facilitator family transporter [Chitinasiproducens palmae]SDV48585.1 cation diffusion facilitator family transporter [Chitinasiproducens palmae]
MGFERSEGMRECTAPNGVGQREKQAVAVTTTVVSIVVNALLVALQIGVGMVAQSQALIADGIHSLTDIVSDGIVLLASRHSGAAPDRDHQYGHNRYETIASLFVGLLLLAVAVGMLIRAATRFAHPGGIPTVHYSAFAVALAVIAAKEGLFRYMLHRARQVGSSLLIANAWHARSDAASSLIVALGVGGSLLGLPIFDPLAAAVVGVLVGRIGARFAWAAAQDLADRAVDPEESGRIENLIATSPGVRDVHALRTRRMGDFSIVDAHVLVDPMISVSEGHYVAEQVRTRLLASPGILDALIHIDPETDGAGEPNNTVPRAVLRAYAQEALVPLGHRLSDLTVHYLRSGTVVDLFLDHPRGHAAVSTACAAAWARAWNVKTVRVFAVWATDDGK